MTLKECHRTTVVNRDVKNDTISDEVWFGVFVEVNALTVLRKGSA
jgi:hypothetical protein